MNVVFRVDASVSIGTGHVMRCLTLADELKRRGHNTVFITRALNGNLVDIINLKNHNVVLLPTPNKTYKAKEKDVPHAHWLGVPWEVDAKQTELVIQELKPEWLVVDHYGIDIRWHLAIRGTIDRIFAIDDLADRKLHCDLLLDQTYGREDEDYVNLVPASCQLLLGSKFAMLRREFAELRSAAIEKRKNCESINRILVCMGGMDPNNVTEFVLKSLAKLHWYRHPSIEVVLNSRAPHLKSVKRYSAYHPLNVTVSSDVENMAKCMLDADLAIGAGGTSSWERCCLGLPSLTISIATNQELIAKNLEIAGVSYFVGNINYLNEKEIRKKIKWLLEDFEKINNMVSKCFSLVDGLGVARVANKIESVI